MWLIFNIRKNIWSLTSLVENDHVVDKYLIISFDYSLSLKSLTLAFLKDQVIVKELLVLFYNGV